MLFFKFLHEILTALVFMPIAVEQWQSTLDPEPQIKGLNPATAGANVIKLFTAVIYEFL